MRNTHTSKKQAGVARILFVGFFGILSTSIIKILWTLKKKNTTPSYQQRRTHDSQNNSNTTPTAPQLQNLNHNHPLSLVPQNFGYIALTDLIISRSNYPESPIQHIITQQPSIEDTYEQIIGQPHTTNFHSQNNHLFSPR